MEQGSDIRPDIGAEWRDGGARRWRFSVAPMMDWTDRHDRYLLRLISRRALLYTEMVTTGALIHGPRDDLLRHDMAEHPVALQLGGSEPDDLARCAVMGADAGYDEINLNCGCPSDRVQNGSFGACLMREPELVAECIAAMKSAVAIPVTVKCRIGVDDQEPAVVLPDFVGKVAAAGADAVIVHARMAWLKGLSPKENRDIPPLDYPLVHRLKQAFPNLPVALNGGLQDLDAALPHLDAVDGVMLGRAAYQRPMLLAGVDRRFFGDTGPERTAPDVIEGYLDHVERERSAGTPLNHMTRHMLGLAAGRPGARAFRRILTEDIRRPGAGPELIRRAAGVVDWDGAAVAA
ncbi:MAG: tRNA dihydrouridine(20/20a) synthase DusA [Pseudomonadota bacterium]|nr:tRNA dihydrouridine(20/20a) synthase DusA [Pseudomonadota bacterium]